MEIKTKSMPSQEREIRLKIAGIGISLRWKGIRLRYWPHPFYQDFLGDGKTEINLRIFKGRPSFSSKKELIFDGQANFWKLSRTGDRYIIEIFSPAPPHPKNMIALVENDFGAGEVYIIPDGNGRASLSPANLIRPLVEILIMNRLSLGQGLLVHASGVDNRGRGIVFVGPSGAGKTTLAKLYISKGKRNSILNDEHLIIRKLRGRFLVFGTPWPGMVSAVSSRGLPIDKIFFIQQAKENITFPLEARHSFSNLFPQLFLPLWDKKRMGLTAGFCGEMIKDTPCYRLGFVKDKSVVDFIREMEVRR